MTHTQHTHNTQDTHTTLWPRRWLLDRAYDSGAGDALPMPAFLAFQVCPPRAPQPGPPHPHPTRPHRRHHQPAFPPAAPPPPHTHRQHHQPAFPLAAPRPAHHLRPRGPSPAPAQLACACVPSTHVLGRLILSPGARVRAPPSRIAAAPARRPGVGPVVAARPLPRQLRTALRARIAPAVPPPARRTVLPESVGGGVGLPAAAVAGRPQTPLPAWRAEASRWMPRTQDPAKCLGF
jgi:hypothetical protein